MASQYVRNSSGFVWLIFRVRCKAQGSVLEVSYHYDIIQTVAQYGAALNYTSYPGKI